MLKMAHPRFVVFLVLLVAVSAALGREMGIARGISAGFDATAALFIILTAVLMWRSDPDDIRRHADTNDGGKLALLLIAIVVTLVVLVTVATELRPAGKMHLQQIALSVFTLATTWVFANTVYALHYAHLYYDAADHGGDAGGMKFPGDEEPDYWDFVYFAFNLGMAFQVSDVICTSRMMRRTVILHCMIGFIFNIGVVALTINIVASAIGMPG